MDYLFTRLLPLVGSGAGAASATAAATGEGAAIGAAIGAGAGAGTADEATRAARRAVRVMNDSCMLKSVASNELSCSVSSFVQRG